MREACLCVPLKGLRPPAEAERSQNEPLRGLGWVESHDTCAVFRNTLASFRLVDLRNGADPSKVFSAARLSYSRCISNPLVVVLAAPLSYTFAFLSCFRADSDWLIALRLNCEKAAELAKTERERETTKQSWSWKMERHKSRDGYNCREWIHSFSLSAELEEHECKRTCDGSKQISQRGARTFSIKGADNQKQLKKNNNKSQILMCLYS